MSKIVSSSELFEAIRNSINNRTPLSYIRMGDGEFQIAKKPQHCNSIEEKDLRSFQLKHIFARYGEEYIEDSKFHNKWRADIVEAIKKSDYCGVFTVQEVDEMIKTGWRADCDYEDTVRMYVPNLSVLEYYGVDLSKLKLCSPMFNRSEELGIVDNFKKLIGDQRFTIITNRTKELMSNKKFKTLFGEQVDFITVTHEHGVKESKALYQRTAVSDQFKNIKGHVVLFAIGGAAKSLCNVLKNDWGKCALDMGSVIDAWAGIISRPSYGNIYSYCLTVPADEAPETDICWR